MDASAATGRRGEGAVGFGILSKRALSGSCQDRERDGEQQELVDRAERDEGHGARSERHDHADHSGRAKRSTPRRGDPATTAGDRERSECAEEG